MIDPNWLILMRLQNKKASYRSALWWILALCLHIVHTDFTCANLFLLYWLGICAIGLYLPIDQRPGMTLIDSSVDIWKMMGNMEFGSNSPGNTLPPPTYTHTPRFALNTSFRAAALHLWDRMSVKDHYRRFSIEKCAKKGDLPQLECIFYLLPVCRGATMTSYTYHIWTKISLHINTMLKTTFLPISLRIVQISYFLAEIENDRCHHWRWRSGGLIRA